MSIEIIIGLIVAAIPGVLAFGGGWVRLGRVERDLEQCVRREVHAEQQKAVTDKLTRIEGLVERLYDRVTGYQRTPRPGDDREDTNPGRR